MFLSVWWQLFSAVKTSLEKYSICNLRMNCVPSIKTVYMMKETLSGLKFIIHVGLHLFNDSSLGMHTEYIIWYINKKKFLKVIFFFSLLQHKVAGWVTNLQIKLQALLKQTLRQLPVFTHTLCLTEQPAGQDHDVWDLILLYPYNV